MLKAAARQKRLEIRLEMLWQASAPRIKVPLECGKVILDKLIQKGLLGAVAHVPWRTCTEAGFPAS